MMRCLIVDDEKPALDLLESNIARIPYLNLVKRCKNAFEAMAFLSESSVDLMFIDIQMPGVTGLELLQSLKQKPQVIIVSAYEQYAIEGFNLDVTDYLIKPVSFERFLKACNKCLEVHNTRNNTTPVDRKYLFVNVEYRQVRINYDEISHIEAMRDYVRIYLENQKPVITHMSMKTIEDKLPASQFVRIHKSYIANITHIKSIRRGMLTAGTHELPYSDNYKEQLQKKLGIVPE